MKKAQYKRPTIETLAGAQILERMGPVSCGSGFGSPQPDAGGDGDSYSDGGLRTFSR